MKTLLTPLPSGKKTALFSKQLLPHLVVCGEEEKDFHRSLIAHSGLCLCGEYIGNPLYDL